MMQLAASMFAGCVASGNSLAVPRVAPQEGLQLAQAFCGFGDGVFAAEWRPNRGQLSQSREQSLLPSLKAAEDLERPHGDGFFLQQLVARAEFASQQRVAHRFGRILGQSQR